VKIKTALFVVLLVFMIGAYAVTSNLSISLSTDGLLNFGFLMSLGSSAVAFADPIGGGPGSGD